jgi:hypothetical protein
MSKILSALRAVDGMARPVALTLNGQFTHATAVGGVLTLLAYAVVFLWYVNASMVAMDGQPIATTVTRPTGMRGK